MVRIWFGYDWDMEEGETVDELLEQLENGEISVETEFIRITDGEKELVNKKWG